MAERGVAMTSQEQTQTEEGPPRGRFTIVYLIHEAFRRDLGRLSAAVRASGVNRPRAQQLAAHWEFVNDQLHHHHLVEDASLWPLVRPKLSGRDDELAVLAEMEAQHVTLLPRCAAINEGFAAFAKEPDDQAGGRLADNLYALRTELATHLDDEESRGFPVIDEALSAEEFESFGKATAKAIGMRGSARFFPWIFDGAAAVERTAVLSMPPPPVRVLCARVWEPRYEKRVATLWA
jgi:iron-sulfur cluster repair protein YtfE (RIC family)